MPTFVNNIINGTFKLFFSGLDEFFKRFGTWFATLAWLPLILLLLLSMQGIDELEPLLVQLGLFYLAIFIARLFWPTQLPKNPWPKIYKSFQGFIKRVLFYGIPVFIFFWVLAFFGMIDEFGDIVASWSQYVADNTGGYYNTLTNLPGFTIPNTEFVIPGGVVLVAGVLAFILLIRRLRR